MWVLKSASVRVFDKVGAISLPVATSKLPSKQHVPMPFVFKLLVFDPTRLHRQSWLGTRFGLYARFFICADDMYALFVKRRSRLI